MRARQGILLCALALLTLGVVMVSSAGMRITPASAEAPIASNDGLRITAILGGRDGIFAGLAVAALIAGWMMPRRLLAAVTTPRPDRLPVMIVAGIVGCVGVLGLVYIPGLSREMNASHRWIEITAPGFGEVSIQPSEIVKWAMVGLVAWCGAAAGDRLGRFWTGFLPALVAVGLVAVVIMKEDLGTAVLVAGVAGVVLLAAGAKLSHAAILAPLGLGVAAAGLIAAPYRVARITAFLDPYQDPAGTGFHMIQSMDAVAGGEGAGRGLGHGLQKFGYLPEDTTDFIFAIICEELGLAGAALVLFIYAVLLICLVDVAGRTRHPVHRLFVVGVLATIGFQACINLLVVTGLAPTKGIALPLISKGGSGWILTCLSLGLVAAMDRAADREPASIGDEGEIPDALGAPA